MNGPGRLVGSGVRIGQLMPLLSRIMQRPVVDQTGLARSYDIELTWTPDDLPAGSPPPAVQLPDPNGPPLTTAIQEQWGLKLTERRGQIRVLVIDHIERPSAN